MAFDDLVDLCAATESVSISGLSLYCPESTSPAVYFERAMVNEECIDLTTTSPEEGSAAKPILIPESESAPLKKEEEEDAHDVDKAHVSVPHRTDDFTPEGAAAMRRLICGSSGGSAGGGGFGISTLAPSSARASRKRRSSFSMNASPAANHGLFPVPTPSGRETPRTKIKMDDKAPAKTPG